MIEYEALLQDPGESEAANELLEKLTAAFGTEKSLGIVAIRGVPNFLGARDEFLPLAHSLAHLPHEYLEDKLSDPKTLYNAGWSHGKEKLGDKPDTAKGSFYFNPLSDKPGTPELRDQFPLSYPCNVWPDDEKIPGFESKAKNIGSIMHKAVVRLSLHIDALAKKRLGESYADNMLYNQMQATDKAKGDCYITFQWNQRRAMDQHRHQDQRQKQHQRIAGLDGTTTQDSSRHWPEICTSMTILESPLISH